MVRSSFLPAVLASTALLTGAASAADLVTEEDFPPAFSWSGFYVGIHGGAIWGNDRRSGCDAFRDIVGEGGGAPDFESAEDIEDQGDFQVDIDGCEDADIVDAASPNFGLGPFPAFDLDGDYVAIIEEGGGDDDTLFHAGGQIGINQQYGSLVLGLEADVSKVFNDDSNDISFEYFHQATAGDPDLLNAFGGSGSVSGGDLDWIATFRGRVGFAAGSFLFYGTGGLALAGLDGLSGSFEEDTTVLDGVDWCNNCEFGDSDDEIQVGYAIGAGGEWAFTETLSLGAEYLFLGFNEDDGASITFHGDDGRSFSFERDLDDLHVVRVKLNLRFPPG
jgi:outer membrane immunogenic protein